MCKPAFKDLATETAMNLLQEAKEKGFDYQDLASFVGSTPLTMKAYTYGDTTPSLAAFIAIWKRVKPVKVLKTFASWSDCVVIQLPEISEQSHLAIISKKLASSLQEFSEYVDTVGNSLADNRITQSEAQKIEKEGYEAIEKILELIETARRLAWKG